MTARIAAACTFTRSSAPSPSRSMPRRAHRATIAALKLTPTRRPPRFPDVAATRRSPGSTSRRRSALRRVRQGRRGAGADARARLRLRRGRHGHAAAAGGQSASRGCSGCAEDRAVINRMGFNNRRPAGARSSGCSDARTCTAIDRRQYRRQQGQRGPHRRLCRGRPRDGAGRRLSDRSTSARPTRPGLRELQDEGALERLLAAVREARDATGRRSSSRSRPTSSEGEPERIVRAALDHRIDALIVANTTVSRPPLKSRHARRDGRPVGRAAKPLALDALRAFRAASGGEIPLIGVGGIADCRRRLGADPRRREPGPALYRDGLRRARASPGGSPPGLRERLKREGIRQHRRGGRQRSALARQGQHHAFAARVGAAVDLAVADQHAVHARILALAGLEVDPALRAARRASRARIWSPRRGSWARARRGSAPRAPAASAGSSRSRRPATWRHRRGSHCRRPSRSRRRTAVAASAGSSASSTSAAACPARPHWRPAGPAASTGLNEKSVIWLLRKKPSTIRPGAEDRFRPWSSSTRRCRAASRTMKCEVPVGSSVLSAPATSAPARDCRRRAAGRRSCRSAAPRAAT